MSLSQKNTNIWFFWFFRLTKHCLIMFLGCLINFPILIYAVIPFILWIISDTPYTWPTADYLMKWVRYGITVTIWVGSILWLSELLPWLVKAIRSRGKNDCM